MIHSFQPYELDEERFELRRACRAVKVEPRVLEVLVYLVRARGRVVTKEELLDQVWKKSFVSDSALTRCIMEARRAIGDPEREVPLIRTVHGRGYRFEIAGDETEPSPSPVELTPEPPAVPAAPPEPRRSLSTLRPIAAVLLGIAIAVSTWMWLRHAAQAAPRGTSTARLALLPISVPDDDRELQMVGMSVADLLEQRLGKIGNLRVRGADYSRPISISAANLVEIGRRVGAEHIISGSVTANARGNRARLTLVLHEIRPNGSVRDTPLGAFQLPLLRRSEDIGHYAVLRDRVVSQVVATVLPAFEPGAESAATPRDFESYRLYLLARERLAAGGCDGEAAIELLRRSLEIDDRFAPAWDAYAWALYRLSAVCTAGSRHHRAALEAADRALALAPTMASAIVLKARVMIETGRIEEAYKVVRAALRKDPANADLQRARAAILAQTGFLDAARAGLQRVAASDDEGVVATTHLYAGNLQRFVDSLPDSDAPRFRFARGFAQLMQGRPGEAHATLEPSFRSNPADAYARLSHALLAIIEGQHADARAIVVHFVRQRALVGETDAEMTYRVAQLAALAGDHALAKRQLENAIAQGFLCVELIERDPALVAIQGTPEHARLVETARRRREEFAARVGLDGTHRTPSAELKIEN